MTTEIERKYNASKKAIEKINTVLPILIELREKNAPNYHTARQAFYDTIIPYVKAENITNYPPVLKAMDNFASKLGILNGIKGWY